LEQRCLAHELTVWQKQAVNPRDFFRGAAVFVGTMDKMSREADPVAALRAE
jgi:hypothetical protein